MKMKSEENREWWCSENGEWTNGKLVLQREYKTKKEENDAAGRMENKQRRELHCNENGEWEKDRIVLKWGWRMSKRRSGNTARVVN